MSVFGYHAQLGRALIGALIGLGLGLLAWLLGPRLFDLDFTTIVWLNVVSGAALLGGVLGALSARFGYDDD